MHLRLIFARSNEGRTFSTVYILVSLVRIIYRDSLTEISVKVQFLADRTNGRAIGTVLRLSSVVCRRLSVCDVMYCG